MRRVKKEGFLAKLDTNGSVPEMIERLVGDKLVDYIAMDIKAPLGKYGQVAGEGYREEDVKRSVKIILESGVEYEFRTTVMPRLFSSEDMEKIGEWLRGAEKYFIQGFRPGKTLDSSFRDEKTFSEKELEGLAGIARKYFRNVGVRT